MDRKIGIHTRCFLGTSLGGSLLPIAEKVASLGGNVLEFTPGELLALSPWERAEFSRLSWETGMELVMTAGRSPQTDPSSPDPEIREQAFHRGQELLKLMDSVSCRKWDGLIYACWPGRPSSVHVSAEKAAALERSAAQIQRIMPLAENLGITLCFEVVNRYEHFLLNTAQEGIRYCEMIGSPNAQLLLDTFHMNIEEDSPIAAIRQTADAHRLAHFHVGEANRKIPGPGSRIDWKGISEALDRSGYTGSIVLEPEILPDHPGATALCLWRDLSNGCTEEEYFEQLKQGFSFIRNL